MHYIAPNSFLGRWLKKCSIVSHWSHTHESNIWQARKEFSLARIILFIYDTIQQSWQEMVYRYDIVYWMSCAAYDIMSLWYDITLDIIDSLIFLIYSDDIFRVCVVRKSINLHSNSTFSCVVKGVISIATSTYYQ